MSKAKIQSNFIKAFEEVDFETIKSLILEDNKIKEGANTNLPLNDSEGKSILTKIMEESPQDEGKQRIFEILLGSNHIDVNAICKDGNHNIKFDHNLLFHSLSDSSLYWAAKLLMKSYGKINLNAEFSALENDKVKNYNILLYLIKSNQNDALAILVENEQDENKDNRLDYDSEKYGDNSPLLEAIRAENNFALELLLNKKSEKYEYNIVDRNKIRDGKTPYEFARELNNEKAASMINPYHISESPEISASKEKLVEDISLDEIVTSPNSTPSRAGLLNNQLSGIFFN